MPQVCVRRVVASGVTALGLLVCAGQALGQTDTRWNNAAGGNWSVGANWDNGVPSGNFNAIIDLLDPVDGYTVTMDSGFSIVGFSLTSADAILDLTNNTLTLSGAYVQQSGLVRGTAAGTGTIQTGIGQSATLRDTTLLNVSSLQSRGTLTIDGSMLLDVCDTGIDHSGTGCTWSGTGDIRMDGASSWNVGATGTFSILSDQSLFSMNAPGSEPAFTLNGTMEKAGGSGVTFVNNVAITNNGTIRAASGTLRFNNTTNFSAGVLTGGAWNVEAGATLDLMGLNITTNRASITLTGAGSAFSQINALATNDTTGTFSLAGGRNYTAGASAFANAGMLSIGTGSTFTVSAGNSFTNTGSVSGGGTLLVNGTLNIQGGTYSNVTVRNTSTTDISGAADATGMDTTFQFQGSGVAWSGTGDIVLNGTSSVLNAMGSTFTINNAEPIRSTNSPGTFPVFTNDGMLVATNTTPGTTSFSSVRLNNAGTMQNPGVVEVQGGHTLAAPDVVNVAGGILTGGRWRVVDASVLDFGAQSITTNRSDVILRGGTASAQFPRLQGFLATNDTAGKLTLEAGESYTTAGNFTNLGTITVDGTQGASVFTVPTGFTLTNYSTVNKKLTGGKFIVIGDGRASGAIEAPDLDIENIDADVDLSGVGSNLVNTTAPDPNGLRNLNTVDNNGKFTIRDGRGFLTIGNFTVNPTGELGVGMGSEFEVPMGSAMLTNFNQGTGEFNDGTFTIRGGRLIAPNAFARILNSTVTLDGPDMQVGIFRREGPVLVNAFNVLERIGSPGRSGNLTISGGYQLDLIPGQDHNLTLLPGSALAIGTSSSPGGRLHIPRDVEFPEMPGGDFLQSGQLTMFGGQLQVEGNWLQTNTADTSLALSQVAVGGDFVQDGLLSMTNSNVNVAGMFTVHGMLAGSGTFTTGSGDFILDDGVLSPGMSPGVLNFAGGDFVFMRGRLAMEILGPVAGSGYDQINMSDRLLFPGVDEKQLVVTLGDGYIPALGATFDLVTFADGRVGDFTDVRLPDIGFGRSFMRMDTMSSVRLVVVPAPASIAGVVMLGICAARRRRIAR
ncbi:MAG: beta strand repeat-containing protein [Phycisphaerales bacterium]